MKLEPPTFLAVQRYSQGSQSGDDFDYATASTEDIKKKVRFNTEEQNNYLTYIHELINSHAHYPEHRDQIIALKQQIADVQNSNSDPLVFTFNSKLSDESRYADQALASFQMTEDYQTMSYDEILKSFREETGSQRYNNFGSYNANVDIQLSDIESRLPHGILAINDAATLDRLQNQVSTLRSEPYDTHDPVEKEFFENRLPNLYRRILAIRDTLDPRDVGIDK